MTSENSTVVQVLVRVGSALREVGRAQEELWARLERIDPDPSEDLHWEPTASGWRLYGSHVPDPTGPVTGRPRGSSAPP